MAKVERQGDCLVFMGVLTGGGYGRTSEQVDGRTKDRYTHRVVYEHHHGEIPKDLMVLHSCDNRPCVEITHLRLGTVRNNAADMVERGRGRAGTIKDVCARGHDLKARGAVKERPTRSRNPAKAPSKKCMQCQREDARRNRAKQGFEYTGQPTNGDKTECKRGHVFTPENTAHTSTGGRKCRKCARDYARAYAAARRAISKKPEGPAFREQDTTAWLARRPELRGDLLLQVGQVAATFAVTTGKVRVWDAGGLLPATRTRGGHRRYRVADIDAVIAAAMCAGDAGQD